MTSHVLLVGDPLMTTDPYLSLAILLGMGLTWILGGLGLMVHVVEKMSEGEDVGDTVFVVFAFWIVVNSFLLHAFGVIDLNGPTERQTEVSEYVDQE